MKRREAFAHQGVPKIGRSQWHAEAIDGTHILSVWEDNIRADSAEAHVHKHAYDLFEEGMTVRIVIQRGSEDPGTGNMITNDAQPDGSLWEIASKEVRSVKKMRRQLLHVLAIKRTDGVS